MALPLRTYAAFWAVIPGIFLVFAYYMSQPSFATATGYWTGVVGRSTGYMIFSCSLCAMLAAVDGSRLRRTAGRDVATARPWWQITWSAVWPTFALAALLQGFGLYLSSWGSWGAPGRFPWGIVAAWLAMIALHISFGLMLGLLLPVVVAAPVALIASYSWLGFLWALDYTPARYLSGLTMMNCCTPESRFPVEAALATITFSVLALIGILIVVRSRLRHTQRRGMTLTFAVILPVLGGVAAVGLAAPLGTMPNPPRGAQDLHCEQAMIDICVYPEQIWRAASDPIHDIDAGIHNLSAQGIAVPAIVTTDSTNRTPGALTLTLQRDFTTPMTLHSLAFSIANPHPERVCDNHDPELSARSSNLATALVYAWMTGGQEDPGVPPTDSAAVASILTSPDAADWFVETREALYTCSIPLPGNP